jgi:hypothetical protein
MQTVPEIIVKAYYPVCSDQGFEIGIAVWGEQGYYPTGRFFPTEEAAQKKCNEMNAYVGLNKKQAFMVVAKSMFPGCIYTLEEVINAGRSK